MTPKTLTLSIIKSFLFDNKTAKQTIFKNTFWLFVSAILVSGVGFLINIWLARDFGPVIYGKWSFAISFATLMMVLADFGFSNLTIREVARDKTRAVSFIDNIIAIKIALSAIGLVVTSVIIFSIKQDPETIKLVFLITLCFVINTFSTFLQSIFRANEKMEYETLSQWIRIISLTLLFIVFLLFSNTIISAAYAYVVSSIIGLLGAVYFVRRYFASFFLKINLSFCVSLFKKSLPFAAGLFLAAVYQRIGVVCLNFYRGDQETGIFNAAYNFIVLFFLLPEYLTISVYPKFSRFYLDAKKTLARNTKQLLIFFSGIGLFLATLMIIFAPVAVSVLYGEKYVASIHILQILSIAIFFTYIAYSIGNSLSSANLQHKRIIGQAIAAVVNIILNIILIPLCGVYGAAISFVVAQVLLAASYCYFFSKEFALFAIK